jgi:predicted DNA-binding transcriptional regulator AlpA
MTVTDEHPDGRRTGAPGAPARNLRPRRHHGPPPGRDLATRQGPAPASGIETARQLEMGLVAEPNSALAELETDNHVGWTGDSLMTIGDIREFFKLGRTAAYELTHRPEFPDPVPVSPRCYRWWASEVCAFATALRRERGNGCRPRTARARPPHPATTPRRITGQLRPARARKEAR